MPDVRRYPTGRKHCAKCGAYRHILFFGRHPAKDKRERGVLHPYCQTCRRRYYREYRQRPESREYARFRAEARRRRAGARVVLGERQTPQGRNEALHIPAEPFAVWLRENMPQGKQARTAWAESIGLNERTFRRIVSGERESVHIDTVDRAVDPATLNELYPVWARAPCLNPSTPPATSRAIQSLIRGNSVSRST